jgi:ribosomal protein L40E
VSQIPSHRNSAEADRTAAAATDLPNVRERNLRSATAHDAVASQQEETAANYQARESEARSRAAKRASDAASSSLPDMDQQVCVECNGTGDVDAELCPSCGGFGTVAPGFGKA